MSILAKPRPIVQMGDYYGPEPRRLFTDPIMESDPEPAPAETALN
jgi:hypothetical protein